MESALTGERKKLAELEREKKSLAQLTSSNTVRSSSSEGLPSDCDIAERKRDSERIREMKDESEKLKQDMLELQRKYNLQQDALSKVL